MSLYGVLAPLLRFIDPERAHGLTLRILRGGLVPGQRGGDDPILATRVWGRDFTNPIGLAAGFDKNAEVIDPMLRLGFGFVEVGSVTPRPQPGNPRPRIFRLPADRAIINRLGFNNEGAAVASVRLENWRAMGHAGLVGVNLGKNRDSTDAAADYAQGAARLGALADYLVINVSSPNTPGLRALQGRRELEAIIVEVRDALRTALPDWQPPLILKIAPDLTQPDKVDIAAVATDLELDGLIVSNTTIARPPELAGRHREEKGGLSGRPLLAPATAVLMDMYSLTGGRLPIIGVGGVSSGRDAYAKIRAGAALVQLYSALVYHGPGLVAEIKKDLAACLRADGFASVGDAVGADHR